MRCVMLLVICRVWLLGKIFFERMSIICFVWFLFVCRGVLVFFIHLSCLAQWEKNSLGNDCFVVSGVGFLIRYIWLPRNLTAAAENYSFLVCVVGFLFTCRVWLSRKIAPERTTVSWCAVFGFYCFDSIESVSGLTPLENIPARRIVSWCFNEFLFVCRFWLSGKITRERTTISLCYELCPYPPVRVWLTERTTASCCVVSGLYCLSFILQHECVVFSCLSA